MLETTGVAEPLPIAWAVRARAGRVAGAARRGRDAASTRRTSSRRAGVSARSTRRSRTRDVLLVTKAELAGPAETGPRSSRHSARAARAASRRARPTSTRRGSSSVLADPESRARQHGARARPRRRCTTSCTSRHRQRAVDDPRAIVDLEELEDQLAELPANYVRIKGIVRRVRDDALGRGPSRRAARVERAGSRAELSGRLVALGTTVSTPHALAACVDRRPVSIAVIVRLAVACLLAACQQDRGRRCCSATRATTTTPRSLQAVDKFVAAGTTPAAYAELARTVRRCAPAWTRPSPTRPSCKHGRARARAGAVGARQADRRSRSRRSRSPCGRRCSRRGSRPTRCCKSAIRKRPQLAPHAGRGSARLPRASVRQPARRRAASTSSPSCKGSVVEALAIRRATERVRNAVSDVPDVQRRAADPAGTHAVVGWEALDRGAPNTWITDVTRRADPDNWPIAGGAADDDPALPEAEVTARGDIVVGGHSYGPERAADRRAPRSARHRRPSSRSTFTPR